MKITAPIFRLTVGVLSLMLAVPCDGEIEFFVHVDANVTHVWCGACRRAVSDLAQPFAGRNTVDSAVDSRTASAAFCRQEYMGDAVDSEVDSRTAMARDWLAAQRAACFPVLPLAATTRRSVCDSHYHFFCSFAS